MDLNAARYESMFRDGGGWTIKGCDHVRPVRMCDPSPRPADRHIPAHLLTRSAEWSMRASRCDKSSAYISRRWTKPIQAAALQMYPSTAGG